MIHIFLFFLKKTYMSCVCTPHLFVSYTCSSDTGSRSAGHRTRFPAPELPFLFSLLRRLRALAAADCSTLVVPSARGDNLECRRSHAHVLRPRARGFGRIRDMSCLRASVHGG